LHKSIPERLKTILGAVRAQCTKALRNCNVPFIAKNINAMQSLIKTHWMEQIMLKTDFLQKRITDVPALHLT